MTIGPEESGAATSEVNLLATAAVDRITNGATTTPGSGPTFTLRVSRRHRPVRTAGLHDPGRRA